MPHSLSSEHLSATSVTLPSPQMIQQAKGELQGETQLEPRRLLCQKGLEKIGGSIQHKSRY